MNGLSKELAITRVNDSNAFLGTGRSNNGIFIWVILIIIFFFFIGGDSFGFGGFGGNGDNGCCCEGHHHHHHHHHNCDDRTNGIFGENGWFILIIFAVLFLFNDGGANTNIINVDTDDAQVE